LRKGPLNFVFCLITSVPLHQVGKLGKSSVKYEIGIFKKNSETAAAVSHLKLLPLVKVVMSVNAQPHRRQHKNSPLSSPPYSGPPFLKSLVSPLRPHPKNHVTPASNNILSGHFPVPAKRLDISSTSLSTMKPVAQSRSKGNCGRRLRPWHEFRRIPK
jgi:hypothetical protein